jgi:hypothetical protein
MGLTLPKSKCPDNTHPSTVVALGVDLYAPAATSSNSQWAYPYLAAAAGGFMSKNY